MTNSNNAQAGAKEQATHDKTMPNFTGNVIRSSVLSPEQVHYVQSFASELGRVSGLQGFAKFVESRAGVMSIALGVLSKDVPVMLGTVVVVSDHMGSSCSVRDFQNNPMPGPEYYRTVYSALTSTKPLFEKLAQIAAKQLRPSFWSRLFGR